jgi:hypothetical protein
MADPNLQYDPVDGWNDTSETIFKTNPSDVEVRPMFQRLFDQIRDFINNILITWANNTFASRTEVQGIVLGQIPNGTLTQVKMASDMLDFVKKQKADAIANTFYSNVNTNSLDFAFGKGRLESEIQGVGLALAYYAWAKGDSRVTYPFTNLKNCDTLTECLNDSSALAEMMANATVMALLVSSNTALSAIITNNTALNAILSNGTAFNAIATSGLALNTFVKSATIKTALIANQAIFNAAYATMVTTMTAATAYFTKTAVNGDTYSGNSTVTIGSQTSFVAVKTIADGAAGTANWTSAKHNHDNSEIAHAAFPTGTGTGTVSPNVFAIGGCTLTASASNSSLTYTTDKYEAV